MLEVLGPLVAALEAGRPVAFGQVVAARGSTPRAAGAMLLLNPDGTQVGDLGGGPVEAEVGRRAAALVGHDDVELLTFALDDDPARADAQTCGGQMTVLVEGPRGPAALAYFRAYRDRLDAATGLTEVVALDPATAGATAAGDRYLFDARGVMVVARSGANKAPGSILHELKPLDGRPRATEAGGWAYLPSAPRIRLLIVGAGPVGQGVGALAGRVGFDVWVVDDRPEAATADRFPTAGRRLVGPIVATLDGLDLTPATYALVVTRGHGNDRAAVGHLAPSPAGYVGMIGGRRKVRAVLDELRAAGVDEAALGRIAAPVGLDIGSETADEIAVSIVAELIARRNRGTAALDALRAAGNRRPPP